MKFFIVLSCLALASAVPLQGGGYRQQSSYSSYSSGGHSGGLSGLGLGQFGGGGVLQARQVDSSALQGFQTQRTVPVTLLVAQPVQATAAIGSYGGQQVSHSASNQYASAAVAGGRAHSGGVIEAAILSTRQVQVVDAQSSAVDSTPAQVVIPPTVQGVHLEFQSQSSPVTISASHIPGQAAAPQESSYEEEADIVRSNIVKPVIHEVNEVITPYRRVHQEVKPVQEDVQQVVTTGHREVYQAQARQAVGAQQSAGYGQQSAGYGQQSVGYSAQSGGQPTILALVADGSSAGLLGGSGSRSVSYGSAGGLNLGLGNGAQQVYTVQGGAGFGGLANQGLSRGSSFSSRSSSSSSGY